MSTRPFSCHPFFCNCVFRLLHSAKVLLWLESQSSGRCAIPLSVKSSCNNQISSFPHNTTGLTPPVRHRFAPLGKAVPRSGDEKWLSISYCSS